MREHLPTADDEQSNRNNLTYITSRPAVMDVLSEWSRQSADLEVRDYNHLAELLQRDTNSAEHRYTPGVFSDVTHTDERRRRSGAWSNIMETIAAGYSLTLSTHSLATKILFREDGSADRPKAVGVEYLQGEALYAADRRYDAEQSGTSRTVMASSEVIIAGGAFNTPQLLKLSGIGPREELEGLDIPVLIDLPGVVSGLLFTERRKWLTWSKGREPARPLRSSDQHQCLSPVGRLCPRALRC